MTRCTILTILAAVAAGAAGCGAQGILLGTDGEYLLTVRDAVAPPGEEVGLVARLQEGDLLRGRQGHVLRFKRGEDLFKAAETDADGVARVTFTPEAAGDHVFTVEVAAAGLPDDPPDPRDLLVACRSPDTRMVICDLDKTVVASGFQTVLLGNPDPMPGSVDVLKRLAADRTVIYLTHRPDYFGPKSKRWLWAQGYPRGPVLLSTESSFLKGSGTFKREMLQTLKKDFAKIEVGIGDKFSDVEAYHAAGLTGILVLPIPDDPSAETLEDLAEQVAALPGAIHVVTGWDQVEAILFDGESYPPGPMAKDLRDRAAAKKKEEEAAEEK
ncbi:MAG: hypothetical protein R6X20_00555 [Phycisphaerae bacterium]